MRITPEMQRAAREKAAREQVKIVIKEPEKIVEPEVEQTPLEVVVEEKSIFVEKNKNKKGKSE